MQGLGFRAYGGGVNMGTIMGVYIYIYGNFASSIIGIQSIFPKHR